MATNKLSILFAASECVPFASSGGLGDVADALPRILNSPDLQAIRVMPYYRKIKDGNYEVLPKPIDFTVPMGNENWAGRIWQLKTKKAEPITYFVEREELFDRSELYGPSHRSYDDNFERFLFYQKAIVWLIDFLEDKIDIVHCNDWQTGLLPLLLKHGNDGQGRNALERTVFTIHNLAYQGIFTAQLYPLTNLPGHIFHFEKLEYYNQINCLKGGLAEADRITTVSETYAEEIQTPEFGCGLEMLLQSRAHVLSGIVNGVDYNTWSPAKDPHIAENYTATNPEGKKACKLALQKHFGLDQGLKTPLIGMVSRMAEQKGFDIIHEAMPTIMKNNVQVIILGSGDPIFQDNARSWAKKWPKKCAVEIGFNNVLAHQIEAGIDIFLMPSRFEPCGLNQLYSLQYGTIPVVNNTGGLADTISDLTKNPKNGVGFKMNAYTATELSSSVKRALDHYAVSADWKKTVKRAMNTDFSWDKTSQRYLDLYQGILG